MNEMLVTFKGLLEKLDTTLKVDEIEKQLKIINHLTREHNHSILLHNTHQDLIQKNLLMVFSLITRLVKFKKENDEKNHNDWLYLQSFTAGCYVIIENLFINIISLKFNGIQNFIIKKNDKKDDNYVLGLKYIMEHFGNWDKEKKDVLYKFIAQRNSYVHKIDTPIDFEETLKIFLRSIITIFLILLEK